MGCPVLQENTIHQLSITFPSILTANANTIWLIRIPLSQLQEEDPDRRSRWKRSDLTTKVATQPTHHGGRRSDFLDCGAQGSTGRNLYIAANSESHLSSSPPSKMRAQIWVGARIWEKRTNVQIGSKRGTWSGNLEEVFLTASFFWTWGWARMGGGGVAQCQ